jgi:PAS domain S-box-containing protein
MRRGGRRWRGREQEDIEGAVLTAAQMRRSLWPFAAGVLIAIVCLLALMAAPPTTAMSALVHGRMLGVHLALELFAIIIASLAVAISCHDVEGFSNPQASVMAGGFTIVVVADLLHALTYEGMPQFITSSSTERAIFFWLAGRTVEVLTLGVIAWGGWRQLRRGPALAGAAVISLGLVALGSYGLAWLPVTFVPGQGVTAFKAGFEVVLCAANLIVAGLLLRADRAGRPRMRLLAMSSVLTGIGELAFTNYVAPSDFQNLFGHLFKVAAYVLLYRATFLHSLRAPFEALRESERHLRESETRLRTLSANLPACVVYQVVLELDGTRRFSFVSEALERVNGLHPQDVVADPSRLFAQFHHDDLRRFEVAVQDSLAAMSLIDEHIRLRRADGALRSMHLVAAPRRLADGRVVWDGTETDVTEREAADAARRALEEELRQAQKMESIGTLASGVAHDFNNVVGAILGNAALAQEDGARGDMPAVQASLAQIRKAAERARELVRQMMTFGRRQVSQRRAQALQPIVEEALVLVRTSLPPGVTLVTNLQAEPAWAEVDATQIAQVVINLCTNAFQAMEGRGGRIELAITTAQLGGDEALVHGLAPGLYRLLSVRDNGAGMEEATRRRIFDPFFTTKSIGKGTGLGLSVVHGIVAQHEGAIDVRSTPGRGTEFVVWLPAASAPDGRPLPPSPGSIPRGHGERVLYVDDDEVMALMVERLLTRHGYTVRSVCDPAEALAALRADPQAFDVVVTDYHMPGMSGMEFARAMLGIGAVMPRVLVSGSVTDALTADAAAAGLSAVVGKQNLLEQLGDVLQNLLAGSRAQASMAAPP